MFKKVRRYLESPYYALGDDLIKKHPRWMSDKYFSKVFWRQMMGYPLDLKNPKTFDEKLQWMKLYDRNPLYPDLVDKIKVKEWVAERIGTEHVIPTLAVYDSVDDIRIDDLPDQFVLKCNHDSGGVAICRDKSSFNLVEAKKRLSERLEYNFFWEYREWPYKNIEPKLFAERFISDSPDEDLIDYKIFTFGGEPKLVEIDYDRFTAHKRNLYDTSWNYIDAQILYPSQKDRVFEKPDQLEEMLDFARTLSKGFRHVRTDFYIAQGQVYFGEMTFIHGAGTEKIEPKELDLLMGSWIDISDKK
jgi:hypothetical protein